MSGQPNEITITNEDPRSEAGRLLIGLLSRELGSLYPEDEPEGVSDYYIETALDSPGSAFVIAWLDNEPVGCGAIRPFSAGVGEIKRMFVVEERRGLGIARKILAGLEEIARQNGFHTLRLETGIRSPRAITLYERAGYARIPCWGKYAGRAISICYEKQL